jgi:hypothetical protein
MAYLGKEPAASATNVANVTTLGLFEHAHTISANYTIASGNNALSASPVTIGTGVTVTVPTGSSWAIT